MSGSKPARQYRFFIGTDCPHFSRPRRFLFANLAPFPASQLHQMRRHGILIPLQPDPWNIGNLKPAALNFVRPL